MQEKRENIFKDLLITFEGIDGSGKSVQARKLLANLRFRGFSAILVRDPGGPVISEKIRELLLQSEKGSVDSVAELMLYEAARAQLLAEKILPAFSAGNIDEDAQYLGLGSILIIDDLDISYKPPPTGIENKLTKDKFKVYPNPASEKLNFDFKDTFQNDVNVTILNILGKTVLQKTISASQSQSFSLDVSKFESGIYFYRIKTLGVEEFTGKFFVK